jgi:hypothetical protein
MDVKIFNGGTDDFVFMFRGNEQIIPPKSNLLVPKMKLVEYEDILDTEKKQEIDLKFKLIGTWSVETTDKVVTEVPKIIKKKVKS